MKKFMKFCVVGICNTTVTFLVYIFLVKIIGVNYMVSSFIGYVAGILNSFTLNRRWTFHDRNGKILAQFGKFAVVNSISLGINLSVLYACVEWLGLGKLFSQLVAIGFSTVVNFLGSKVLVFHEKDSSKEDEEVLGYIK